MCQLRGRSSQATFETTAPFPRSIATPSTRSQLDLPLLNKNSPKNRRRLDHIDCRNGIYFVGLILSITANWMPSCLPLSRSSTATRPALAAAPTSTSFGHLQRIPRKFLGGVREDGKESDPTIHSKNYSRPSFIFIQDLGYKTTVTRTYFKGIVRW